MSAQDPSAPASYFHGPFQQLVGYDILHNERGLYFQLPIRRDHLNPHGVLHGGVPLTLLDAVGGRSLIDRPIPGSGQLIQSSVTVTRPPGRSHTHIQSKYYYLYAYRMLSAAQRGS